MMDHELFQALIKMEGKTPMTFFPPAAPRDLAAFRCRWPQAPQVLFHLWEISDGLEIQVTGTVLYSVREALDLTAPEGWVPLGYLSFGDPLYLDGDGQVLQMDHEKGKLYLSWPTLRNFLEEELEVVEE